MSSAYGKIDRPKTFDSSKLNELLPIEYTTKNNKQVSVHSLAKLWTQSEEDVKLISYLRWLLNEEIQAGNSYPQKTVLNPSEFENYFLSGDVFVVLNGGKTSSNNFHPNLEENILGTFYIKPNFPGRCSHVIIHILLIENTFISFRFVMEDLSPQVYIEIKGSVK